MAELTVKEVAAALRVHPYTVQRWLREGRLQGRLIGGKKAGWRISAEAVERLGWENTND